MAMTQGSVSVNSAGVVTKSGAAGAFFDALVTQATADFVANGAPFPTNPTELAKLYGGFAKTANVLSAIVPYITANAKAQILTSDSGLQRTPNPNNADTATQGPSGTKLLAII